VGNAGSRMGSKETQDRILECALDLFNTLGSGAVSAGRIAETAAISKGNLAYHFSNRQSIILAIFDQMQDRTNDILAQMREVDDLESFMALFEPYCDLVTDFRFLFRELLHLTASDPLLKHRYKAYRNRQLASGAIALERLTKRGVFRPPRDPYEYGLLGEACWLITYQWLDHADSFLDLKGRDALEQGRQVFLNLYRPYLVDPV
jgi:AcrR family transcriptional regulator